MIQYENQIAMFMSIIKNLEEEQEMKMRGIEILKSAVEAMKNSPPPCAEDCKYRNRHQKCTCCVRNYKNLKDCYEREVTQ